MDRNIISIIFIMLIMCVPFKASLQGWQANLHFDWWFVCCLNFPACIEAKVCCWRLHQQITAIMGLLQTRIEHDKMHMLNLLCRNHKCVKGSPSRFSATNNVACIKASLGSKRGTKTQPTSRVLIWHEDIIQQHNVTCTILVIAFLYYHRIS